MSSVGTVTRRPLRMLVRGASERQLADIPRRHDEMFGRLQYGHSVGVSDVKETLPIDVKDLLSHLKIDDT